MQAEEYWCELTGTAADHSSDTLLGSYLASSPRLAIRWMRDQAIRVAEALDPDPTRAWCAHAPLCEVQAAHLPDPCPQLRAWVRNLPAQEEAMNRLVNGFPYSVTARDATAFYSLSARPLAMLFATQWRYGTPSATSPTGRHRKPPAPEPSLPVGPTLKRPAPPATTRLERYAQQHRVRSEGSGSRPRGDRAADQKRRRNLPR